VPWARAGHAAKVKCLQDKIDDTDMGEDCRKEIDRDLKRTAEGQHSSGTPPFFLSRV